MSIFLLVVLCFAALIGISLAALLVGILVWQHYSPIGVRPTPKPTLELEGTFAKIPPGDLEIGLGEQIPTDMVEPSEVLPTQGNEGNVGGWPPPRKCPHGVPLGKPCADCMGPEKFKEQYGDWRDD